MMNNTSISDESVEPVRSVPGKAVAFVRFFNNCRRQAAIYWVNHNGQRVRYATLGYSHFIRLTTYEGHPWMFDDAATGDVLVTSKGERYYFPVPWGVGKSEDVFIRIPIYTLRERCIQVIREYYRTEDIEAQILPEKLKRDIFKSKKLHTVRVPVVRGNLF